MKKIPVYGVALLLLVSLVMCKKENQSDPEINNNIHATVDKIADSVNVKIDTVSYFTKGSFNGFGLQMLDRFPNVYFCAAEYQCSIIADTLMDPCILGIKFISKFPLPDSITNTWDLQSVKPMADFSGNAFEPGEKNYILFSDKVSISDTVIYHKLQKISPDGIQITYFDSYYRLWSTEYFYAVIDADKQQSFLQDNYSFNITKKHDNEGVKRIYVDFKCVVFNLLYQQKTIKGHLEINLKD